MADPDNADIDNSPPAQPGIAREGAMDHILDIMTSHRHPVILVGSSAHRWMGSTGNMSSSCDLLIRDTALQSIAQDLVNTGHWELYDASSDTSEVPSPAADRDADLVLRNTDAESDAGYQFLTLWSETVYRLTVDTCPLVEVPDLYAFFAVLVEEKWHPAIDREDGWWYGPRIYRDTKAPNIPETGIRRVLFSERLPRGKSEGNPCQVYIPSLVAYLDALICHVTQYKRSRPELAATASWQMSNLVRFLYLELPHQQLPLLIELEEYEFMDSYLERYKRKPRFAYRRVPGTQMDLETTRVKEWDPSSYPDWVGVLGGLQQRQSQS